MELVQLQCFVALAETLNFKKAAEMVFISQSSMSRYIAGLESEFKVSLFERGKNFASTKLTTAGKVFLPKAKELLQTAAVTKDYMQQFSSERFEQQALSVALDMRLSHGYIPGLLYEYSKTVPYTLSLQTVQGEDIPKTLDSGDLDLGIAIHIDEKYLSRISYQAIAKLPLFVYVHEDILRKYQTEDPIEILRHEKLITVASDVRINSHIMSILYEMGLQPSFLFGESPYHIDFMVNTCKAVSLLPDSSRPVDPQIHKLPVSTQYGSLVVYGLFPFESAETTALVDYLKERLNTAE